MDSTGWILLAVAGVVLGSGVVMITVGVAARRMLAPFADGRRVTAVVVALDDDVAQIDGRGVPVQLPVYEFSTADGTPLRGRDQHAARSGVPAVGDRVEITYRPDDPSRVRRDVEPSSWPGIVVASGVVTVLIAGALIGVAFAS